MPVGEENPGEKETIQTSLVINAQTLTLPTVPELQLIYQAAQTQSGASNTGSTLVILTGRAGLTFATDSFNFMSLLEYSNLIPWGKKKKYEIEIFLPNVKRKHDWSRN